MFGGVVFVQLCVHNRSVVCWSGRSAMVMGPSSMGVHK